MRIILELADFTDDSITAAFVADLRQALGNEARIVGVEVAEPLLNVDDVVVIKIDPPLPCSAWLEDHWCGEPATRATATASLGGEIIIAPLCRTCAVGGMWLGGGEVKQPPVA